MGLQGGDNEGDTAAMELGFAALVIGNGDPSDPRVFGQILLAPTEEGASGAAGWWRQEFN